ncbi:hypothetical protein JG677_03085 [Campylobacter sp. TTU-622]|uniref:hypothetical protein n=1 Tax=Campylobacter sp. TTU-622 TaxID=2800583 RepID=UPI001908D99B|nr:hypothetical protein [Campylobacter sp. TTU-622]MBK1973036.1 hypothetical protein [Campylobacter sp. TTU-622]
MKRISNKLKNKIYKYLELFVKELSEYVEGNIFTLYVDDLPEEIFIGCDKEEMLKSLKRFVA